MPDDFSHLLWLLNRFVHITAATLLVGGTLFYALVVPRGIDDLKESSQTAIIARLRWVFRWIVYSTTIALIISGAGSWVRNWETYTGLEARELSDLAAHSGQKPNLDNVTMKSGLWFHIHMGLAATALVLMIGIIRPMSPPRYPITWLRVSMVVLLMATLAASMTRHSRLRVFEALSDLQQELERMRLQQQQQQDEPEAIPSVSPAGAPTPERS